MDLTIEEFKGLADEKSQLAVKIAEMERMLAEKTVECEMLRYMVDMLEHNNAATHLENLWLRNYITLSVEKIKKFVQHLKGVERFAFLKTFLEYVLPQEHYKEQLLLINEVMEIPDEHQLPVAETHNHFEAGSGCQVFNDKVTGQFDKQ